jgi:eukaryotic-like serine/threonine-protein kinase
LRVQCPAAPAELEAVVARCLEKDPNRRFQDVGELAIALYPFAPRRARLSAERCCYVLRTAGLSQVTLEHHSTRPPPNMDTSDIGVTLPGDAISRTTGPSAVSMKDVQLQGSSRSIFYTIVACVALVTLGALALLRQRPAPAATVAAAAPPAAAAPVNVPAFPTVTATPPAAAVETAAPLPVQAIIPGSPASAAAGSLVAGAKAKSAAEKAKAKAAAAASSSSAPAPAAKSPAAPSHEVDVGF